MANKQAHNLIVMFKATNIPEDQKYKHLKRVPSKTIQDIAKELNIAYTNDEDTINNIIKLF